MSALANRNLQDELNRMNPAAHHAQLGSVIEELITKHNELLAKLDADIAVTDSDYVDTLAIKPLAER